MTSKLLTLALASLALGSSSAMAMGWPSIPAKKAAAGECCGIKAGKKAVAAAYVSSDGFVYVGGDAGWQLGQHKYGWRDGKVAMADDCPVSIAKAKAAARARGEPA